MGLRKRLYNNISYNLKILKHKQKTSVMETKLEIQDINWL